MCCHILPIFSLFDPFALSKSTHESSRVCKMKTGVGEERRKKTILERARGHFNYFSFALAFWSFPIKIWCKTARLSWSTPNLATRGRTMSNKLNKAKNCSAICRHFHSPRKIYHAAFKHENIGHNKMKRKVLYYRLPVHCQYVQCARRSPAYRN